MLDARHGCRLCGYRSGIGSDLLFPQLESVYESLQCMSWKKGLQITEVQVNLSGVTLSIFPGGRAAQHPGTPRGQPEAQGIS